VCLLKQIKKILTRKREIIFMKLLMKSLTTATILLDVATASEIGRLEGFQSGIDGSWYDQAQSGQGFSLEYLNSDSINGSDNDKIILYHYTFSEVDGAPYWLVCVGDIGKKRDNVNMNAAELECFHADNGIFLEESDTNVAPWGIHCRSS
jgi:hypothetical protein